MSTLLWTIIVSIIFYVVVRYIYNYRSCYLWTLLSEIKYMMMMMIICGCELVNFVFTSLYEIAHRSQGIIMFVTLWYRSGHKLLVFKSSHVNVLNGYI